MSLKPCPSWNQTERPKHTPLHDVVNENTLRFARQECAVIEELAKLPGYLTVLTHRMDMPKMTIYKTLMRLEDAEVVKRTKVGNADKWELV